MNELFTQPIGIYIVSLGMGFILPLLFRAHRELASIGFIISLLYLMMLSGYYLVQFIQGMPTVNIQTAGIPEPFAINLHYGLFESGVTFAVNIVALLGAWQYLPKLKEQAGSMLVYLLLVMGINGMVMTRDLFNLFIFIEITSIATYALIGMERTGSVLVAGMKYIIATSIASAFYLVGTMLIYHLTGTLNIDDIVQNQALISGPIGLIACLFIFSALVIELKPYPANGWGLDVYETTPGSVAAIISVGVSAGILFALYKVLPILGDFINILVWVGGLTFLLSNLIGLKQRHTKRLLGYSSIGQMGLVVMALALLIQWHQMEAMVLIVGGLFLNHLFAKAGLFWLSDFMNKQGFDDWQQVVRQPIGLFIFGALLAALIGLPPFPGFWAKWQLVMIAAEQMAWGWIGLILIGSLLEAAYLYRWFTEAREASEASNTADRIQLWQLATSAVAVISLFIVGYVMAEIMIPVTNQFFMMPLYAGLLLWILDGLPGRIKLLLMIVIVALASYGMAIELSGVRMAFAALLIVGGLVVSLAGLYRTDQRPGFYPLLAVMLLSLMVMLTAVDTLGFFYGWEIMTLSSYLLITLGKNGNKPGLTYLLFSLGSAYFLFSGFALTYADTGSTLLIDITNMDQYNTIAMLLLGIGFLIKIAGFGAHIWLPGAYAEADDDLTAILSAIISKASIFGLIIIVGQVATLNSNFISPHYILGWLGILTALFGALMAVFQEDIKKLVAYSSMGQVGYIVTGIALMSHMGWTAAFYGTLNHFMFKAISFLSVAGIIFRTGERMMYKMGGLIKNMPLTFFCSMIAIIAMSGVPPLTGFGGKWMMFNALMEKGWYWMAATAFFASAVAFLYMYRYLHTVFLGQRKLEHRELKEAPIWLIIPQLILVLGIFAISAYPKLILLPISEWINPYVGGQLSWQGDALVSHLGQWNAPLIMTVIGIIWMIPLILLLLISMTIKIQKVEQFNMVYAAERPSRPEHTHFAYNFFAHYRRALGFLVEPRATAFWQGLSEWSHSIAASARVFYTGNGQTYALFILMFFIIVFIFAGGLSL